jgi:soluble lytic murein transglycosylase-like protein
MTRVNLAAAIAAGMTTFAVHAQEAPTSLPIVNGSQAVNTTRFQADPAATTDEASSGSFAISSENVGHAMGAVPPGVEIMTTSALKEKDRPELIANARKEEIGKPKKTEATPLARKGKVETSGKFSSIISRYASAYGVPVSLAHAVIRVESNYRPDARGSAGEVGLMQIKPATARGMGYSGSAKGLYNPETNIKFGMKYLGLAHKLGGGSTCGTILKYNAGHGAKRMNPISAAYCTKVKRLMGA